MPTGYTADIKKGITFEQYAMHCARAFGALVDMREEPGDAKIPEELKPSDYHAKELHKAKIELAQLCELSIPKAAELMEKEWLEAEARRLDYLAEQTDLLEKYNEMLAKAKAWLPPTKDHDGLYDFMIDQIEQSIKFDCGDYTEPTEKITPEEWLSGKVEKAKRMIEYHDSGNKSEIQRTNERNNWIRNLRESLIIAP